MKNTYKTIICILLMMQMATASFAQDVSIKEMLSAPFPSSLVSDPNTDQIAWVFNKEGIRNIWYAKGPAFKPVQLTTNNYDFGRSISELKFSADGSHLYFRKGDAPNSSGEYPNPRSRQFQKTEEMSLHRIELDSNLIIDISKGSSIIPSPGGLLNMIINNGKVYMIRYDTDDQTEAELLLDVRGSISEAHWVYHNDKVYIAFISNRGDHALAGLYDTALKSVKWLAPSVDNDASIAISKDHTKIAFLRIPSTKDRVPFVENRETHPWSIMYTDLNTMQTTNLWTAAKGYGSAFRGISSSSQLFWTCENQLVFPYEKDGYTHLWSIEENGKGLTNLTPGQHEVQYVNISPDGCEVLFSSNEGDIDRQHIWSYDFKMKTKKQHSNGNGVQWLPVKTKGGSIFSLASTGSIPAHVAVLDNGKADNILPELVPDVFRQNMPEPEQVIFNAPDGMKIHGQLFKPQNIKAGEKLPAVMFFHGGSRRQMLLGYHHRGYYHNAFSLNQYMANQGYIVLSVNFRSGIGYGLEFREALEYGANGASEYNDVLGGAMYLGTRSDVDKNRIGLWGGSYGGYLTALGLSKNSDLFAAGVDIHGVHDWNEVIRNFVPSFNPEKSVAVAKKAYESSPMNFMDGWRSPVLLIHGDDDRNVPFSETVDLVEQLRKRDVYFEQLIFPDEVHGFLLHENWLSAMTATFDFFERKLKNKK